LRKTVASQQKPFYKNARGSFGILRAKTGLRKTALGKSSVPDTQDVQQQVQDSG